MGDCNLFCPRCHRPGNILHFTGYREGSHGEAVIYYVCSSCGRGIEDRPFILIENVRHYMPYDELERFYQWPFSHSEKKKK